MCKIHGFNRPPNQGTDAAWIELTKGVIHDPKYYA